jgi:hypothetical protein
MARNTATAILLVSVLAVLAGCSGSSTTGPSTIDPADFVTTIDNPYFALAPGTVFLYEGPSGGEPEVNKMVVTHETKSILGVACVVVADSVKVNGELVEATIDWYAQDKDGNVWYFGEDSKEYENGVVVSTAGSWEAGVDGAEPGYVMLADPDVGHVYRQEYYRGEAEDMAQVLSLDASTTVPYGSFQNCLETKEWTPLEPGVSERKYYAAGVGMLSTRTVGGGDRSDLVSISAP